MYSNEMYTELVAGFCLHTLTMRDNQLCNVILLGEFYNEAEYDVLLVTITGWYNEGCVGMVTAPIPH